MDVTDGILLMGEAAGVTGYIGPATRPADLKRYRSITEKPIWCPGFGRQDRQGRSLALQLEEWAGIVGPRSAAIVGSLIYDARNPVEAVEEIIQIRDRVKFAPPSRCLNLAPIGLLRSVAQKVSRIKVLSRSVKSHFRLPCPCLTISPVTM